MSYLESDGMIYDQRLCKGMKYGFVDSSKNGCGWVACYNLLHLIGYPYPPEGVCKSMAAWLPFGGLIGTHILPLYLWLRKHTSLRIGFVSNYTPLRLKQFKGGIVWYFTGKGMHFAAFSPTEKGKVQFYNAIYGDKNLCCTLSEFRKKHSPFRWMMVLSVPK